MAGTNDSLLRIVQQLAPVRLAVIGDLMVDRTRHVDPGRLDKDTAALIVRESAVSAQPGGAAYVAALLVSLAGDAVVAGISGRDAEGEILTLALTTAGCRLVVAVDPDRPTTLKERLVVDTFGARRLLARIDRESTDDINGTLESQLVRGLNRQWNGCRGVLISDYAKGVCTESLVAAVISAGRRRGLPIVVDPARRDSFARYAGCDVLTPSRRDAESATGLKIDTVEHAVAAGLQICRMTPVGACVITLDRDGAVLVTADGRSECCPARAASVVDPTGAGDAFAAALLHALACGIALTDAVRLANAIAGIQVSRFGTATLTLQDVQDALSNSTSIDTAHKIQGLSAVASIADQRRRQGQRIVLTNGCFDLLHAGHVGYLEQARAEGDCLVVALNSDSAVARLKGESRPVMSQEERARTLAALASVDFVVIFDEPTPHEVIRRLRPDVLVKGGDYSVTDVVGRELAESCGGIVKTLGLTPGLSTSTILHRLASSKQPQSGTG